MQTTEREVMLVNNTSADIRMFEAELMACVCKGEGIPKDLEDCMTLTHIVVGEQRRGILNWKAA